jgi:small nuclear ribonucleoprotein (snRNP)-like protein
MRIEGIILGFDEFMNLVMDEATEVNVKSQTTKPIGELGWAWSYLLQGVWSFISSC